MAAEPTGTIEPIPPGEQGIAEMFFNYINQPLNTEDPLQNLVSGASRMIPGISTALAKREGDMTGEMLSYLDYIGGGAANVALTPLMIARRKELQQTLKNFDKDPILRGNESVRTSLTKELDKINKQEAEELRLENQFQGFRKDPETFRKKSSTVSNLDDARETKELTDFHTKLMTSLKMTPNSKAVQELPFKQGDVFLSKGSANNSEHIFRYTIDGVSPDGKLVKFTYKDKEGNPIEHTRKVEDLIMRIDRGDFISKNPTLK